MLVGLQQQQQLWLGANGGLSISSYICKNAAASPADAKRWGRRHKAVLLPQQCSWLLC
jgi:hypothetical protein